MDIRGKTVAVTGASGMLGVYVCRALMHAGANVVGVVRNPAKADFLAREGVEFRKADLMDRAALTEAFHGVDAVVSNAALYDVRNQRWADHYRANKEGTENVYESIAAAGVRRVVHISTFGVYRLRLGGAAFTEDSAVIDGARKQGGAYRATKQLSEALAFMLSKKHGLDTTALRPAGIYGARDSNMVPYLRMWFRLPVALVPTFRFPFVYAGDVADAVVGALLNDDSRGKAYLTAGANTSIYEFARAWKEAANSRSLLIPIPIGTGVHVDCSKAEREIGFKNTPFVQGLRETFEADLKFKRLPSGAS